MRYLRFILVVAVLFLLPGLAGAGWVQQNSETTSGLGYVSFVDVQTGWVGSDGGFLLHTTDGGANWKKVIVDPALQFVSALWFRDTSYGWVCGSEQGGFLSDLYATSDGGNHWSSLKRDSFQCYFDVEFVTPFKGWLVSSILMSNGGGKGFLYYTSDGGTNWVIRDSSVFPSHAIYWDISFADSMMGMLAAGNPGVDESFGYMKKTTNGGLNWAMIESGPLMFRRIRLLDRNLGWRVWFCDFRSQRSWGASKTTNGGNGWSGIFYRNTVSIAYPPFTLIDAQKGWIQMYDTLFGTSDGGQSWGSQVPPGIKQDICFTDSLNGWLVGAQGLILHTTDGGSGVWSEDKSPQSTVYSLRSRVIPDPFISFTTVPGHSSERFALYDISGKRVGTYKGDRIAWDVSPGVYFLRPDTRNPTPDSRLLRVVKLR